MGSMKISAELEEALRDGGDQAITLVLHEAIKRKDVPMIAHIMTKIINNRAKAVERDQCWCGSGYLQSLCHASNQNAQTGNKGSSSQLVKVLGTDPPDGSFTANQVAEDKT